MLDDEDDVVEGELDLFKEPDDFYQAERQHTTATHTTLQGQVLTLRLVGHNPLWGHYLWNAGRTIAAYLETNASNLVNDKTILELGAGAGLPSLICAINGAKQVHVTDYPDADLIENLQHNIETCSYLPKAKTIDASGYLWGASTSNLRAYLPEPQRDLGFDLLILADLLFNHSEHSKLVATVQQTLQKSPLSQALVFFTPYRPWLLEKDLAFFDLARDAGFHVEMMFEEVMERVMFEEDPGDELLRRTVFGYRLTWTNIEMD